jgi:hypothetical protein
LSAAELARYRRDGYLVREHVFGSADVAALGLAADAAASRVGALCAAGSTYHLDGKRFVDVDHVTVQFEHAPRSERIRVIEPVHELAEGFDALVDDPRLVVPMQQLVGARKLALWTDKLNLKPPHGGSAFGWHQDAPYWIHDCAHVERLPNVLVAIDDAHEANGCFRVIRGSHRAGCLPGTADGSQLGGFYTDPGSFDAGRQVAMRLPAGSVVFFSPFAVHGSGHNGSDQPRRAVVLTYQPGGHPMLKSGRCRDVGVPLAHGSDAS